MAVGAPDHTLRDLRHDGGQAAATLDEQAHLPALGMPIEVVEVELGWIRLPTVDARMLDQEVEHPAA